MNVGPITLTNTVSGVVLGVLLILVGGLVWLLNGVYKTRTEARVGREAAQHAEVNTRNVSNGFAKDVNLKLDNLIKTTDEVQIALTKHLEWHLGQEKESINERRT